jgi:hypothetical protein
MKRYQKIAIGVVLLLLLLLFGSWGYVGHPPWDMPKDDPARGTISDDPLDTPAPSHETTPGNGNRRPLEAPDEPVRRGKPPEPVDTDGTKEPTSTGEKTGDTIIAELTPNMAAVRDGNGGDDGLEPLIVSTLRPARERIERTTNRAQSSGLKDTGLLGASRPKDKDSDLDRAFARRFIGRLVWPTLSEEDTEALQKDFRRQAVVYFEKLPEFRAIVQADEGWFSLPMTNRMEDDYRAKGLKLVVHSPAFEIEGGFEAVMVKKDQGEPEIKLRVTPMLQVTVDVSPPEAIESGVRVWLERQGLPLTPDHDDSLYISANVPESGRLVFSVPEHYGEIRLAATGEAWHSGLPQIVKLRDWKTNKVTVSLQLAGERCDRVTGTVISDYRETPVLGARLESTHYGTTVYAGPGGAFQMWVPLDSYAGNRQFHCTAANLRPEVLPLETRANGTAGVEGNGPTGPFRVTMTGTILVELHLPKEASRLSVYRIVEKAGNTAYKASGRDRIKDLELPWGTNRITLAELEGDGKTLSLWIGDEVWKENFKLYATSKDSTQQVTARLLEDVFKKR